MHNCIGRILQDTIKYFLKHKTRHFFFPNFMYLFDILCRSKRGVLFRQDIILKQIFTDPMKHGCIFSLRKGSHGGSVHRGRGLSCKNANAQLIGWSISCAGHVFPRRYYRVSYWLKNQREKYWENAKISREWFAVYIG